MQFRGYALNLERKKITSLFLIEVLIYTWISNCVKITNLLIKKFITSILFEFGLAKRRSSQVTCTRFPYSSFLAIGTCTCNYFTWKRLYFWIHLNFMSFQYSSQFKGIGSNFRWRWPIATGIPKIQSVDIQMLKYLFRINKAGLNYLRCTVKITKVFRCANGTVYFGRKSCAAWLSVWHVQIVSTIYHRFLE